MSVTITTLIGTLCDRMGWPADTSHKVQALDALNTAEKWISQQGSFLYLSQRTTLALPTANASVNAPAGFDYGKAAIIADVEGTLEYEPLGDFDAVGLRTGGYVIADARPGYWSFAFSGAQGTVYFKPTNATGSTITYTFVYQKFVADLVDDNSSKSLLPEGYEKTILIDRAEWYLKKLLARPMSQRFLEELDSQLQAFYAAQRMTKPESKTDGEVVDAKQYERQLRPGV